MADEQAQAEATATETPQEQTPVTEVPSTEQVDTPTTPEATPEPDRGDPRIAMQEERRKRQDIERQLNDPNFIYERARTLGLAADETPSAPPVPPSQTPTQSGTPDVASIVEHQLDFRETIKSHPELNPETGDKGLVAWAAALVDKGHKPSEAADIIFKTISKQAGKSAATEVASTLDARATSEAQKLNAAAITSTAPASSTTEDDELEEAIHNWKDPAKQEAAIIERGKRRALARQS